jgi:hypothetical protein
VFGGDRHLWEHSLLYKLRGELQKWKCTFCSIWKQGIILAIYMATGSAEACVPFLRKAVSNYEVWDTSLWLSNGTSPEPFNKEKLSKRLMVPVNFEKRPFLQTSSLVDQIEHTLTILCEKQVSSWISGSYCKIKRYWLVAYSSFASLPWFRDLDFWEWVKKIYGIVIIIRYEWQKCYQLVRCVYDWYSDKNFGKIVMLNQRGELVMTSVRGYSSWWWK